MLRHAGRGNTRRKVPHEQSTRARRAHVHAASRTLQKFEAPNRSCISVAGVRSGVSESPAPKWPTPLHPRSRPGTAASAAFGMHRALVIWVWVPARPWGGHICAEPGMLGCWVRWVPRATAATPPRGTRRAASAPPAAACTAAGQSAGQPLRRRARLFRATSLALPGGPDGLCAPPPPGRLALGSAAGRGESRTRRCA